MFVFCEICFKTTYDEGGTVAWEGIFLEAVDQKAGVQVRWQLSGTPCLSQTKLSVFVPPLKIFMAVSLVII